MMCRHAAAVGPGAALTDLFVMPHGLERQSYAARELLTGTVCADGFGVAWYEPDVQPEPGRYASAMPVWSDANLRSFGALVRSPLVLAAVRNATVPGAAIEANCAPFVQGVHAFSHNGYLGDFDNAWREWMRADWIAPAQRTMRGTTDSEHLFRALLSRLNGLQGGARGGQGAGAGSDAELANAVVSLLRDVRARAEDLGTVAQLNVLVSDGKRLLASRAGTEARQNSLYLLSDGDEFPGSHVVASEPLYDDPDWQAVAEDTLLVLEADAPPVRLRI